MKTRDQLTPEQQQRIVDHLLQLRAAAREATARFDSTRERVRAFLDGEWTEENHPRGPDGKFGGGGGGEKKPKSKAAAAAAASAETHAAVGRANDARLGITPEDHAKADAAWGKINKQLEEVASIRKAGEIQALEADLEKYEHGIARNQAEISKLAKQIAEPGDVGRVANAKTFSLHEENKAQAQAIKKIEKTIKATQGRHLSEFQNTKHREQLVRDHMQDRGLADTHAYQSSEWVTSSNSRGALQLHAALLAGGVPGSLSPVDLALNKNTMPGVHPEVQKYVKEMYTLNQAAMRAAGVKEVTLYRGVEDQMRGRTKGEEVKVATRPASSWSDKPQAAEKFAKAGNDSGVLTIKVPATAIYASHHLFGNYSNENEYVVLGAAAQTVTVRAVYNQPGGTKAKKSKGSGFGPPF